MKLKLKIVPGAASDRISGWLDDRLKIAVTAPALRNQANRRVIALLAAALKVPVRDINIVAGQASAMKTVEIDHLDQAQLCDRLETIL